MTDTEYLRGLADNENLPKLMRDSLRDAADEIERLRAEVAGWQARHARDCAELRALRKRIEDAPWQPIETAPKDGSTVILRRRGNRMADGFWLQKACNGMGAWIWPYVHSEPTHWMPLPPPPKEE